MTKPRPLPSQSDLRAMLDYDPETGTLLWKPRVDNSPKSNWFNSNYAFKPALTTLCVNGYPEGRLPGMRHIKAHRVIWKMVYGYDPTEIDHINGDRADNRLVNLRDVTHSGNQRNRATRRVAKSGVVGVYWYAPVQRFRVTICKKYVGVYRTFEDAVAARKAAEQRLGFQSRHGSAYQKQGREIRVDQE